MKNNVDYLDVLEGNCWSLICESYSNGDDASMEWLVIGYYMAHPFERVLGHASEEQGPKAAINIALETTKDSQYDYIFPYESNK